MTVDDSATSEALDVVRVDVVAVACTAITAYTRIYIHCTGWIEKK